MPFDPNENPWADVDSMSRQMSDLGLQLRYSADGIAPSVPHADGYPHVQIPRQAFAPGAPGGAPSFADLQGAQIAQQLLETNRLLQKIANQNDLILRFNWIRFVSDASLSPTGAELPIQGSGGVAYTSGTYIPFYTNKREYPTGIYITANWVTPGARIKFSLNTGDNGLIAELQNGGPNGGTITPAIILNPGQTLFSANFDPFVPFNPNDAFRIRSLDIANNLKNDVFRTLPWPSP